MTPLWSGLGKEWEERWESPRHRAVWSGKSRVCWCVYSTPLLTKENTLPNTPLLSLVLELWHLLRGETGGRQPKRNTWLNSARKPVSKPDMAWLPPPWSRLNTCGRISWPTWSQQLKQYHKPTLGVTEHFHFVSLSPTSKFRFLSNRCKRVAYHLSFPNTSVCIVMSLPLTTAINLGTSRNFPAFSRESGALDQPSWGRMSTSDASTHDHSKQLQSPYISSVPLHFTTSVSGWFFCLQSFWREAEEGLITWPKRPAVKQSNTWFQEVCVLIPADLFWSPDKL